MGPLIFVLSLGKATLRFLLSPFCDLILPDAEWLYYIQIYGSGNKIKEENRYALLILQR